ncbi:MAG: hypothetical protein Q7J68_05110 [Thermoplasmata archaeon]|nr:hypothetical protein [Thermoplasmata archaeon]
MVRVGNDAIAGAFEELPSLLVVLVAISLFSVSVAHASISWNENSDYLALQEDCIVFAGMVRNSKVLGMDGQPGTYDSKVLLNLSEESFFEEFNSTLLGFGYRVVINCIDSDGQSNLNLTIQSSEIAQATDFATAHTCVNVDMGGKMAAARVAVTIWRLDS